MKKYKAIPKRKERMMAWEWPEVYISAFWIGLVIALAFAVGLIAQVVALSVILCGIIILMWYLRLSPSMRYFLTNPVVQVLIDGVAFWVSIRFVAPGLVARGTALLVSTFITIWLLYQHKRLRQGSDWMGAAKAVRDRISKD